MVILHFYLASIRLKILGDRGFELETCRSGVAQESGKLLDLEIFWLSSLRCFSLGRF